MEQYTLKNVNNCLNTNIYSYLETCGGRSSNLYLNVVHFFNTSVNNTSVAPYDSYFPALISNTCCSIIIYLRLCPRKGIKNYFTTFIKLNNASIQTCHFPP